MGPLSAPIGDWLNDFSGLLFPRRCAACDMGLYRHEKILCTACRSDLPLARFHDDPQNRVEQLFFGRVPLHAASSYLLFDRSGVVQRMLHRLKYKNDLDLGIELGCMMANDIKQSDRFKDLDLLVPVPLHAHKLHRRGYNQSDVLVEGMCKVFDIPSNTEGLIRSESTSTQTKKGRLARWTNVKEAFHLRSPEEFIGRHVLVVDDVVTTGATIESCVQVLAAVPDIRISLYTAACA